MPVPADMVLKQIDAVVSDIGVDAVKIGMIGSPEVAEAVAERLSSLSVPIVFDPVMVASSGAALASPETITASAS
jgi:hydroxymethylpyrimidine/phosphomethylpyrimidine kinase